MKNENKAIVLSASIRVLLTVIFILLRIDNVIQWSWYWVLFPLWSPVIVIVVGAIIGTNVAVVIEFMARCKRRKAIK